jgi:hypothetical protein
VDSRNAWDASVDSDGKSVLKDLDTDTTSIVSSSVVSGDVNEDRGRLKRGKAIKIPEPLQYQTKRQQSLLSHRAFTDTSAAARPRYSLMRGVRELPL